MTTTPDSPIEDHPFHCPCQPCKRWRDLVAVVLTGRRSTGTGDKR